MYVSKNTPKSQNWHMRYDCVIYLVECEKSFQILLTQIIFYLNPKLLFWTPIGNSLGNLWLQHVNFCLGSVFVNVPFYFWSHWNILSCRCFPVLFKRHQGWTWSLKYNRICNTDASLSTFSNVSAKLIKMLIMIQCE